MKGSWILIGLLFISIAYAAERISLLPGGSFQIDDKNITLVKLDSKANVAVFCVNGIKSIASEGKNKMINGVGFDITYVKSNEVEVKLTYKCKDCECINCDNSDCFTSANGEEISTEEVENENNEPIIITPEPSSSSDNDNGDFVESPDVSVRGIVIAGLIIIVLVLGLIILWKRT